MLDAFPSILTHIDRLKSHFIGTFIYDSFSQTHKTQWDKSWVTAITAVTFHKPNLNSRVHVIVDIIVFQHTMAIVIEVDHNLFKWQWKYFNIYSWY